MENANKGKVNLINGKDKDGKINHEKGLKQFKDLLKKIKAYKDEKNPNKKPKKILIATDADACLFRGYVTPCAGQMGMGVMSDMVYVYRNIFKLCEEADIKCDFCFLTKLQPYQCNPFFKQQLSERLGKDKKGNPFIKPKDIKFAPYDGENGNIDHDSFNKKMFDEEGYKNTEVLYFDNDLDDHKITRFIDNLKIQKVNTVFPVNIIHTEDVKNWITEEKVREDIVKKRLEQDLDFDKDKQEQLKKYGGKSAFIKTFQSLWLEQKTAGSGNDFNEDGLKVDELLTATQDVLFENKSKLKEEQNKWIKQNFETDKALANKLFKDHWSETYSLYDQTADKMNQGGGGIFEDVFYKVAKDTFDNIEKDPEIRAILEKYPKDPSVNEIPKSAKVFTQNNNNKKNNSKPIVNVLPKNYDKKNNHSKHKQYLNTNGLKYNNPYYTPTYTYNLECGYRPVLQKSPVTHYYYDKKNNHSKHKQYLNTNGLKYNNPYYTPTYTYNLECGYRPVLQKSPVTHYGYTKIRLPEKGSDAYWQALAYENPFGDKGYTGQYLAYDKYGYEIESDQPIFAVGDSFYSLGDIKYNGSNLWNQR